jgi:GT2 family glycosyltransferase
MRNKSELSMHADPRNRMVDLVFGGTLLREYGNGFLTLRAHERLVSVIIPGYCHEAFVAEAVASVGAQTHDEVEVLFIDDGSSDHTYEVAVDALRMIRFPWCAIKVHNRGAVVNLNAGIEIAHGGWISLLASDDVLYPHKVQVLLAAAERENADVAIGLVDEIDRKGHIRSHRNFGEENKFCDARTDVRRMVLEDHFSVMTQGMQFRRSLFSRIGLFSPEIYTEDYDFTIRMFEISVKYVCVPSAVAGHRHTRDRIDHAHLDKVKRSWLAVASRHARNGRELRRARGVLLCETGFNKIGNGYPIRGAADVGFAFLHSPLRVFRLLAQRVAGRIRARSRRLERQEHS